jgi:hypothetical protein
VDSFNCRRWAVLIVANGISNCRWTKQRTVFSPGDLDYCQSQFFQIGIIGPVADDTVHTDSYAYISGRGIENAISKAIVTTMGTQECVWQQDDIMDCFNTVPTRIAEPVFPTHTWNYIENVRHRYRELTQATGLPQGHPVSASVINVVINTLLLPIRQAYDGTVIIIVYSDDLTLIGPRVTVKKARAEIQAILAGYGMKLNPKKSRIARPVQGHPITLLGYELEWTSPHSWPLIRPRRKAYHRLEESLADALDLNHAEAIERGWQNAYRLTNDARHQTRMKLAIESGMTRWRATTHRTQGPDTGGHR